ncbi:hypothetical protein AP064_03005 [Candidatus Liberibacter solanacearum]|nr:hypothetical protein KP07_00510 [Candidatus Liberibacter solanacearum]KQC49046.1 hypothetical protein AP064_03005 [Candidatus Liberibacter solanacearum]
MAIKKNYPLIWDLLMLARTKMNKIRYDTELKSCRKLKKTNFFSKKTRASVPKRTKRMERTY